MIVRGMAADPGAMCVSRVDADRDVTSHCRRRDKKSGRMSRNIQVALSAAVARGYSSAPLRSHAKRCQARDAADYWPPGGGLRSQTQVRGAMRLPAEGQLPERCE